MQRSTEDTRTEYPEVGDAGNTETHAGLEARLRAIQRGDDFPALSRAIVELLSALPDDDASLQRLANVVMREYSLTLRVIRTANSAIYRRSDRPIQSATHAMMLLGAGTVRKIAGGLLLFEHYHRKSPGLRELMLMSLLTANHAREIAVRVGGIDPEEAHLCGMLRNLGEVLVAAHLPTDFARIRDLVEGWGKTERQAAGTVLGCGFDMIGASIGRFWGLPDSVLAGMRADGPHAPTGLGAIVALSHELTTAVYRRGASQGPDQVSSIIARHASRVPLTVEAVGEVLTGAQQETREVFASSAVKLDDLRLRRQTDAALAALGVPSPASVEVIEPGRLQRGSDVWREQLRKAVAAAADIVSGDDVHRLLMVTLEGIYQGCPLDRAIMLVLTPNRRELHARLGFGEGVDALVERFRFRLIAHDGPIAQAAIRRRAILVPMERDFTAQEARWAESLGASSVLVVPLLVHGRLVGCVYGDRAPEAPMPSQGDVAFLRELCVLAEHGLAVRRGRVNGRGGAG